MKDNIRTPIKRGQAIQRARNDRRLKATDAAARSGRARNVLYRLERGEGITVASLFGSRVHGKVPIVEVSKRASAIASRASVLTTRLPGMPACGNS